MSLYNEKVAELERFIKAPEAKDLGEFSRILEHPDDLEGRAWPPPGFNFS